MSLEQAQKALSTAKTQFLKNKQGRALAAAVFALEWKFDSGCPTAYTNGLDVTINPDFFMSLSEGNLGQRVFLIAHETWHVLLKHQVRGLKYAREDFPLFNQAADHVINNKLIQDGYEAIDQIDICADSQYRDWSTEQVMEELLKQQEQGQPPASNPMPDISQNSPDSGDQESDEGSNGEGQGNQSKDKPMTSDQAQELENKLNNVIAKTHQAAKQSGSYEQGFGSSEMERILEEILNPKIPWQILLQKFCLERFNDDYSWSMPNWNYQPGWYVPSLYSEGMGQIGLFVDSSGSVSDEDFQEFRSNMHHIIQILKPKKTVVAEFDTKLREPTILQEGQSIMDVTFTGYGGTDIEETMDYIHKEPLDVAVIFTDGYFTNYVPKGFRKPVIWVIKGRYEQDFDYPQGDIIYMED